MLYFSEKIRLPPRSTPLPYTTLFRSQAEDGIRDFCCDWSSDVCSSDLKQKSTRLNSSHSRNLVCRLLLRSEEHTSELQSPCNLRIRFLFEKKKPQNV